VCRTAVFFGDQLARYGFGGSHPWGTDRIYAFWSRLQAEGLDIVLEEPETTDEETVLSFHEKEYVELVKMASKQCKSIPLHFYNYYGYYSGSFYPREKLLSGFLIVKQVENYTNPQKRLAIAREFVETAMHNMLANLEHYKKNGKDVQPFMDRIQEESAGLASATGVPELMGMEGRSRDAYYSSFDSFLREGFEFDKRTRMPPQNMLNSLISFGNSLLYATVLTEIYHTQLTPTVSYLHEPGERRYSLSLDISEVFKPLIVDRVIFGLINNRIIKEEHFAEDLNYCYLNEQGRRTFLAEYQKKLDTTINNARLKRNISYQRLIRIECFKLVKHLLGEKDYRGLRSK
jgi:CRISPR-associated protein Cas1